ncbi:MAG TPA: type II toxin-antitoxin system VapC family toxin [Hanamia sp.]
MDKKESVLIDSDVLINFFDKSKKFNLVAENAFFDFEKKDIQLCVSVITVIEMIQGNKTNIEKNRIIKQLESFYNIPISDEISKSAKDLIINYSSSHGLLLADAFIAATALLLNLKLFTFNKKDFKFIKALDLYEP